MNLRKASSDRLDGLWPWLLAALLGLIIAFFSESSSAQSTQHASPSIVSSQAAASEPGLSNRVPLTEDEIGQEASRWGLTAQEYSRYLDAMKGLRGHLSGPGITPIEVLGIEAQTPAERQRYAEMWVHATEADTAKVLRFSNEVHAAWQRIYPGESLIDMNRVYELREANGKSTGAGTGSTHRATYATTQEPQTIHQNGRVLLFTRSDSGNEVVLSSLLERVSDGEIEGLDIYLVDLAPDNQAQGPAQHAAIQAWARQAALPVDLVKSRVITLNYDGGALEGLKQALKISPSDWPVVIQEQSGSYALVSLDRR